MKNSRDLLSDQGSMFATHEFMVLDKERQNKTLIIQDTLVSFSQLHNALLLFGRGDQHVLHTIAIARVCLWM